MKEKTPHCPHCRTAAYVVLDKKGVQVGTAVGGTIGAGAGSAGVLGKTGSIFAAASAPGPWGTILAVLMALLAGCLAGAKVGGAIGEHIDGNMRIRYRCNSCGQTFNG